MQTRIKKPKKNTPFAPRMHPAMHDHRRRSQLSTGSGQRNYFGSQMAAEFNHASQRRSSSSRGLNRQQTQSSYHFDLETQRSNTR